MADADRLEANFARLIHADNTAGLSVDLETRALAHAQHALDLMAIGAATERVRKRLYALAAAFTGTALWAAIDRMEPDRAGRHLDRGLRLARLSGDTAMEMRLWGHASVLYVQQRRLPDAVAAAEMSSTTHVCRRDPLFRSLAAARLAAVHAQAGERAAAHRALSRADAAFHRINAMERPAFVDFYDRAEFEGLAGITMLRLARHEEAEGHLHHALACLRPEFPSQSGLLLRAAGHCPTSPRGSGGCMRHCRGLAAEPWARSARPHRSVVRAVRPRPHHPGRRYLLCR
ncbi:hypothetical protein ACWGRF_29940 [Streptomyces zhihengii]